MKTCKDCLKNQPDSEFPFDASRTCFACHRIMAQNYNARPWPIKETNKQRSEASRKAWFSRKKMALVTQEGK